jgi:hypothetical protein
VVELMNASSARDAAALVSLDSLAIALIKSALFMIKEFKRLVKNFLRVERYVFPETRTKSFVENY